MQKAPFGPRYYEDPSIARCCAVEYDRLWEMIAKRVAAGEWFYRAREVVLAEELPDVGKAFGSEVVARVSKAIQHTSQEQLPVWATLCAKDNTRRLIERTMIERDGKIAWYNRVWLRLTGYPFWWGAA